MLTRFRGVYIEVYRNKLPAPSAAVYPFTPKYKRPTPVAAVAMAKFIACSGVNRPRTRTRFFVLDICESNGTSWYWLTALAAAEHKPVPTVHIKKVVGSKAAGAIAYPIIDVRTTSAVEKSIEIKPKRMSKPNSNTHSSNVSLTASNNYSIVDSNRLTVLPPTESIVFCSFPPWHCRLPLSLRLCLLADQLLAFAIVWHRFLVIFFSQWRQLLHVWFRLRQSLAFPTKLALTPVLLNTVISNVRIYVIHKNNHKKIQRKKNDNCAVHRVDHFFMSILTETFLMIIKWHCLNALCPTNLNIIQEKSRETINLSQKRFGFCRTFFKRFAQRYWYFAKEIFHAMLTATSSKIRLRRLTEGQASFSK